MFYNDNLSYMRKCTLEKTNENFTIHIKTVIDILCNIRDK